MVLATLLQINQHSHGVDTLLAVMTSQSISWYPFQAGLTQVELKKES